MTKEEAIWYLQPIADSASLPRYAEALNMAIAALKEQESLAEKTSDNKASDKKQATSEWISVKDRLPGANEYVWCYSNKNGGYMFIGYRGHLTGDWMENGILHIGDVTHWMPLPEPPKEDVE